MSSGTNNERVIQNNNLLEENNVDLDEIKELVNSLPDKFNDIIYNTDGAFSNPVEDEVKTYTASKTLYPQEVKVSDIIFIKNLTSSITAGQIIACKVLSVKEVEYLEEDCYELQLKILKVFNTIYDTKGSTATANDILYGKYAYSNGSRIEGDIKDTYFDNMLDDSMITIRNTTIGPSEQKSPATQFYIPNLNNSEQKQLFKSISANVLNSRLASHIALTPEKLKKDEEVLGVVGTYEGSSGGMKEYSTIASMKADIENILEGELVKVTSSSTPRYFIKRTTMIELVIPETQEYYDVYWE